MKDNFRKPFRHAVCLLAAFAMWTAAVCLVDVQAIGPEGSAVGFAAMNGFVHRLTGVHITLYILTDWLSLIPLAIVAGFAVLGVAQWINRRHILKVDYNILVLGGFYIVTMAAFLLFETAVVNYRPVLIDGVPEASYPSSTTMLVLCVMPTAILQWRGRIRRRVFRRVVVVAVAAFTAFMVIARLLSGVHWFSDIVGGVLLSAGLVLLYDAVCRLKN